jgi:hypothetical protein
MRRLVPAAGLGLALATSARAAGADAPTEAEALFRDGNALAAAGRYADACPKLAESQRLEPAVGTQFNLADCYEHIGRTATAYLLFVDVARIARAAGRFERERLAKQRSAALESRLARVRLRVEAAPPPGLEIRLDGTIVPREQWAVAAPVDPGAHRLTATAPGRTSAEVMLDALAGRTVDAPVPDLAAEDGIERPPARASEPARGRRFIGSAELQVGMPGGPTPFGDILLRGRFMLHPRVGAGLLVGLPIVPSTLERPTGEATIRTWAAGAEAYVRLTAVDSPFDVGPHAGVLALWLAMSGVGRAGNRGASDEVFTSLPFVGMEASVSLSDHVRLRGALSVGTSAPATEIHFAGQEASSWGRPVVLTAAGVAVAL